MGNNIHSTAPDIGCIKNREEVFASKEKRKKQMVELSLVIKTAAGHKRRKREI